MTWIQEFHELNK